jgi:hypothetical protein
MKTLVKNYVFSPSLRTITFSNYSSLVLDQILLVTNVSKNTIIYNFADSSAGGWISGNVLNLSANTSLMSNTDNLQIFIDDYTIPALESTLTSIKIDLGTSNNFLQSLNTTVSTNISSIRISPVFSDFDSTVRYNGHFPIGGRYVDATSFSPITSVSAIPSLTGFDAAFNIDVQTGGAMALQGDLDKDIDSVTTFDVGYASISNFLSGQTLGTVVSGTGVQVLSANANRITMFGQNLGVQPLLVKYGLGCNPTSFNFILYPGTAAGDGRGEKFSDDRYKGDVSVNTTTGVSAQYIFWEGV